MFRSSLILLLLTFSVNVNAQGFDYNYLQLNYGNVEFDDINVDGDGFGLSGSYAIKPNWHVFAGYEATGLDFGIDATTLGAGIGYNTEMAPALDMYARLSYQYVDFDAPGIGGIDDSGLGLGVGLRFAASEDLELNGGINYVDFGDGGDDTGISAGLLYSFTEAFSLGLGGIWSDSASSYTIGGRFYFGQ
jgi:opacity protein-like surface antigen